MEKTMIDLREGLFETLAALRSKENPMELDRARMIVEVSQTIINSAKAEVDFARVTGANATGLGFFDAKLNAPKVPLPIGIKGVVRHTLQG